MLKKIRVSLLGWVAIAIACGIILGQFMPASVARVAVTFNGLFGNFLSFAIPLIIVGLVAPAIGELGKGAGRLLIITACIAYGSTIFSGYFTYFSGSVVLPQIITQSETITALENPENFMLAPYFTVAMPPLMDIMTALLLAFVVGLGLSSIKGSTLQACFTDFRDIIMQLIRSVIVPLLPVHIFGIFLNITVSGQVITVIFMFLKVIVFIFILHVVLLLIQFTVAGVIARRNPFVMLKNMLPAYLTALGTQSSAATIPVTLRQVLQIGVREHIAVFTVPLCATIHLAGSTLKIVACSMAVMMMAGEPVTFAQYGGFILMLGITMVAAPGVPGGAIMAALGLLAGMLGFNETLQALMIALYIAMDSFGTACNVTGDGAIAVVLDRITKAN